MRKIDLITTSIALCLISAAPLLLCAAPLAAQSDDIEMKNLVQDIVAYFERCQGVQSSPPTPLSRSCANEKAEIVRRQRDLHVSDAEVNAQLKGRGGFGRWP